VRLDRLLTGNYFAPGHRIRIVVMASFMPHFSRNPQTGARETVTATTRAARIEVCFGPTYPAHLELPILDPIDAPKGADRRDGRPSAKSG
jgi:predicted acyl esterase